MTVIAYQARTLYRGHYADPVTGKWRQENQYVCRVAVDHWPISISWYNRDRGSEDQVWMMGFPQ